ITLLGCVMLVVWILHWFSSARRIRRLRGRRWIAEPIFAGQPFTLAVEIHNPSKAAQVGLVLHHGGPVGETRWPIPRLAGGASQHYGETVTHGSRGRYSVGPLTVSSRLPFGLMVRTAVLAPEEEIIVLPQLGCVHWGRLRRRLTAVDLTIGQARH